MWSVVNIKNDNSVETVPSFWMKKDKCAWPKKNPTMFIKRRILPNKFDFEYLDARKIGKDYGNILEAKRKTIQAQDNSNLSSANEGNGELLTRQQKIKKKFLEVENKKKSNALWDDIRSDTNSSDDHGYDEDKDPPYSISKMKVLGTPPSGNKCSANTIESDDTNNLTHSYPGTYKRKLEFSNKCKSLSPKLNSSTTVEKENDLFYDTNHEILVTSASPFKVTTSSNAPAITKDIVTEMSDTVNKINRTTLNIWYEVKTFSERLEKLENTISSTKNPEVDGIMAVTDEFFDILYKLPLESEEELESFEIKLLDDNIKKKMMSELSRIVRPTLQSTIRAMLRFLFTDSLLMNYSYKGQKKKKIFSTLVVCSLIFSS
ncbi:uncharacterized protein LOC111028940 [Myzus persicae]|uniref:uncharacterized protein LOC111028940 n=1 Tax=Myzus persicae TaxID=13164 RepID=UPI000B9350CC|nr:uncharacterized protein LOC111028940 [Myzus persicae]